MNPARPQIRGKPVAWAHRWAHRLALLGIAHCLGQQGAANPRSPGNPEEPGKPEEPPRNGQ
eukprot:1557371-Pyramimonas_sp.AAC.1